MNSDRTALIIDDETDIRELVGDILEDEGYDVTLAANAAEAREKVAEFTPGIVLLDIWMPDTDGVSLLREWSQSGALGFPVVMMSGHGTVETAVEATRLGAADFVEKPISMAKLLATIEKARQYWASRQIITTEQRPAEPPPKLVGVSQYIKTLRQAIERVAQSDDGVCLCGPNGTGKSLVARHIHHQSTRSAGPVISVRADGIDAERAAIEWFGLEHDGVLAEGLLQQANGGTLILLNAEELDAESQRLLLSSIERGAYKAVGAMQEQRLNVRFVITSELTRGELLGGGFDVELYHRLAVIEIETKALAEHLEDVPSMIEHFVDQLVKDDSLPYRHFDVSAQNRIRNHSLSGGVRELHNIVKRALTLGGEGDVTAAEIDELITQPMVPEDDGVLFKMPLHMNLRDARNEFERYYLQHQLRAAEGSMAQLSARTGMERTHLYRKLRNLGLDAKKEASK